VSYLPEMPPPNYYSRKFEDMLLSTSRPASAAALLEFVELSVEMKSHLACACTQHRIDLLGPPID